MDILHERITESARSNTMDITNNKSLDNFFREFGRLRGEVSAKHFERLQVFFNEWSTQYESQKRAWSISAERFNVLEVLGVESDELSHSSFLAYLLRPSSKHDQGPRFLRSFLEWPRINHDAATPELKNAKVYTEYYASEFGRLDIVIFLHDGTFIVIENKVWATERPDQISDYQKWAEEMTRGKADGSRVIFLTPDGRNPESVNSASTIAVSCLSYSDLAAWLKSINDIPPRLKTVLGMYGNLCASIGVHNND